MRRARPKIYGLVSCALVVSLYGGCAYAVPQVVGEGPAEAGSRTDAGGVETSLMASADSSTRGSESSVPASDSAPDQEVAAQDASTEPSTDSTVDAPRIDSGFDAGPPLHGVLFGGGSVDGDDAINALEDTWLWDGAAWTEQRPAASPSARFGHAMASRDGGAVLFGGCTAATVFMSTCSLGDTWLWDGTTWTQVATQGPTPTARGVPAMATIGTTTVMFGGVENETTVLGDTWLFDGSVWSAVTGPGPSARSGASMTALGDVLVLFGGTTGTEMADTWIWNGTSWSAASPATSPPARADALTATVDGVVLLFGGIQGSGMTTGDDLWSYDGTTWTQSTAIGAPSARGFGGSASVDGAMLVFGGATVGGTVLGDTWTWSQSVAPGVWTALAATQTQPPARESCAMASY